MNEYRLKASTITDIPTSSISGTTILMPIGGKATRAHDITKDLIPKHLIALGDKTVLDVMCENLQAVGFRKFIFCVGHHKDKIRDHLGNEAWIKYDDVTYDFSEESEPLGVDGAVLNAISNLDVRGKGIIVPGDMLLPWKEVALMDQRHAAWKSDITVGVTSFVTKRSGDIGKMIVDSGGSDRILWCYNRNETNIDEPAGCRALTCAAPTSITIKSYVSLCQDFLHENPAYKNAPFSMRDHVIPWAIRYQKMIFNAYDFEQEALDLGTYSNIVYAQADWESYASI